MNLAMISTLKPFLSLNPKMKMSLHQITEVSPIKVDSLTTKSVSPINLSPITKVDSPIKVGSPITNHSLTTKVVILNTLTKEATLNILTKAAIPNTPNKEVILNPIITKAHILNLTNPLIMDNLINLNNKITNNPLMEDTLSKVVTKEDIPNKVVIKEDILNKAVTKEDILNKETNPSATIILLLNLITHKALVDIKHLHKIAVIKPLLKTVEITNLPKILEDTRLPLKIADIKLLLKITEATKHPLKTVDTKNNQHNQPIPQFLNLKKKVEPTQISKSSQISALSQVAVILLMNLTWD